MAATYVCCYPWRYPKSQAWRRFCHKTLIILARPKRFELPDPQIRSGAVLDAPRKEPTRRIPSFMGSIMGPSIEASNPAERIVKGHSGI
jgi:hypothetical protein